MCTQIPAAPYIYICVCVCVYVCVCVSACIYKTCMYVCKYMCVGIYINIYIYVCIYIYIYIHTNLYIYIYIYIYISNNIDTFCLYNFGEFIHQFQPETKTLTRKLERILLKSFRQNVSLLFNQTCLNERMLPNYT